jgi:hypothetical protein
VVGASRQAHHAQQPGRRARLPLVDNASHVRRAPARHLAATQHTGAVVSALLSQQRTGTVVSAPLPQQRTGTVVSAPLPQQRTGTVVSTLLSQQRTEPSTTQVWALPAATASAGPRSPGTLLKPQQVTAPLPQQVTAPLPRWMAQVCCGKPAGKPGRSRPGSTTPCLITLFTRRPSR